MSNHCLPSINQYLHIDKSSKSVKDFISLINRSDFRSPNLLYAQVILSKSVIPPVTRMLQSAKDFEDFKVSICGDSKIEQGNITLEDDPYCTDVLKINRSYVESTSVVKSLLFASSSTKVTDKYNHCMDENYWKQILNHVPKTSTYWHNLELDKRNSLLYTETKESEIHPNINDEVDNMAGINTPMFYLAARNSFSEMHIEDADLPSINIVHYNISSSKKNNDDQELNTRPAKIWLIVPDKDILCKAIKDTFNECAHQLMHKNIFVTPKFLDKQSINYFIVLQYPGDAVFVKCSVFHQVFNYSPNFAEAINYGTLEWNVRAKAVISCHCENNHYAVIQPNSKVVMKIQKKRSKTFHECPEPGCAALFFSLNEWGKHLIQHHKIDKPFVCNLCNKKFKNSKSQTQHICKSNASDNDEMIKETCLICNIKVMYLKQHLKSAKHKRNTLRPSNNNMSDNACRNGDNILSKKMSMARRRCSKCYTCFNTIERLFQHEKNCKPFVCHLCERSFANKWSITRHLRQQHP